MGKPKEKYILHYRNLKQYLSLGLKLSKVHRVLMFKQSPWLKEYIDMNTQFRQEANNKFEVNLYKLMNNSFFGKTCEDVRKYNDVKIVKTEDDIEKLSKKENFKRWHIYNENLASVLMEKTSVTLNKPRCIGSAILALSKTVMYEFHYSYMTKKFKDECPNNTILEFVGLRSKMYSILPLEGEKKATAKGVSQRVTKKVIKHNDYKTCLMNDEQMYHRMVKIGHTHHQLETQDILKKSLSPFNDKKWIQKNGSD